MPEFPKIVNVSILAPRAVYPPDGDTIPPFLELEDWFRPLRADLLQAMPPYLSFKADAHTCCVFVDYDWLLAFCDPDFRGPVRDAFFARIQSASDLVAAHVDAGEFEQFLWQPITARTLQCASMCLQDQGQRRQYEGRPGFMALLKHGMGLESVLPFQSAHWSISIGEITAERFAAAVGREPENDDLDRCNCPDAGNIGHLGCGWCRQCEKPRFICGHMLAAPEPSR